jgi:hypothetical protein
MTEEYAKLNEAVLKAMVEAVQNHIIFIERHNLEILARAVATALSSHGRGTK